MIQEIDQAVIILRNFEVGVKTMFERFKELEIAYKEKERGFNENLKKIEELNSQVEDLKKTCDQQREEIERLKNFESLKEETDDKFQGDNKEST